MQILFGVFLSKDSEREVFRQRNFTEPLCKYHRYGYCPISMVNTYSLSWHQKTWVARFYTKAPWSSFTGSDIVWSAKISCWIKEDWRIWVQSFTNSHFYLHKMSSNSAPVCCKVALAWLCIKGLNQMEWEYSILCILSSQGLSEIKHASL